MFTPPLTVKVILRCTMDSMVLQGEKAIILSKIIIYKCNCHLRKSIYLKEMSETKSSFLKTSNNFNVFLALSALLDCCKNIVVQKHCYSPTKMF